ncbi:hypothetical protein D0T85_18345 [Bacteroides sp. 519]|nr:hypothetical protein [Bacteroides sp. 519]
MNVPLITEATYEGSFYTTTDTTSSEHHETYSTVMLQKLIVVKDLEANVYSCYIATIIPAEENATKNSTKIDKMFYGGDPNSDFSGTIVYSTVTTNYTIGVEKYTKGQLCGYKSMFYASENHLADLDDMTDLLGSARLKRNVRTLTKNSEFGGGGSYWLPDVIITAPKTTPTPPPPPPSLPPPYVPPTNSIPDYYYPPAYIPPAQPPRTGSGTGSSQQYPVPRVTSPGASAPDIAAALNAVVEAINDVLPEIYEKLKAMGVDLNKYKIKFATNCYTNAIKEKDGTIGICQKFVYNGYTINDQVAIIWHEIYHVDNDKIVGDGQILPSAIMIENVPSHIEHHIKTVELNFPGSSLEDYKGEISIKMLQSPQYYRNEIAAYKAEIATHKNVSSKYNQERAYVLWKHEQTLIISEKYYKK